MDAGMTLGEVGINVLMVACFLVVHVGGKHLGDNISWHLVDLFKHPMAKKMIIYPLVFLYTKNFMWTAILGTLYLIVMRRILHEDGYLGYLMTLPGVFGAPDKPPTDREEVEERVSVEASLMVS